MSFSSISPFPSVSSSTSSAPRHRTRAIALRRQWLMVMFLGDLLFAYAGLALAYWLRFHSPFDDFGVASGPSGVGARSFMAYQPVLILGLIFLVVGFWQQKVYNWKLLLRPRRLVPLTLRAVTFWFVIYLCTSVVLKFEPQISRMFMVYAWISVMFLVGTWKWLFSLLLRQADQAGQLVQRVAFVGWSPDAAELADEINGDEGHPYRITGWFSTDRITGEPTVAPGAYPPLGGADLIEQGLAEHRPDILVVADLNLGRQALSRIAKACEVHYVQLKILPSMFQIFVSGLRLETISGRPLLGIEELPIESTVAQAIKRVVDIAGALVGLSLSAPIMAFLAWRIKKEDPEGPILYRQTRSGLKGEPFTIYKLRSMKVNAEANGAQWAQKNDPRRLKIGAFMRETNLDELPQFWNVLKGDMSLVGPRPERPELIKDFELEIDHYNQRHHVKPGITGWAQIHGLRGDTDLSERIRYDCYYIENWSLWMDVYCLVMTFVKRDNAY